MSPVIAAAPGGLSSPLHTLQNQVVGGNRRSITLKSVFGGSGLRYVIDDCPLRYNEAKKYEERIAAASVTLTKFKVKFLSIASSYYLTLSQSFKNFSIPISVSGCFNICLNTL